MGTDADKYGNGVMESGSSLLPFFFIEVGSKVINRVLALLSKYIKNPIIFSLLQWLLCWSKLSILSQIFASLLTGLPAPALAPLWMFC